MTARRKNIITVIFVAMMLFVSSIVGAYASMSGDSMNPMSNHKMSSTVRSFKNSGFNASDATVNGGGLSVDTTADNPNILSFKVQLPSNSTEKSVNIVARYPKFLKYGNNYFDVTINVTTVYGKNQGQKINVGVNKVTPGVEINNGTWDDSARANFAFTIKITNSSTGEVLNPAIFPYYIGMSDIDEGEVYRIYNNNLSNFWHNKNLVGNNKLYYENNGSSIDITGTNSDECSDPTQQQLFYQATSGNTTLRYGSTNTIDYGSGISFVIQDINYTVNYQWIGDYPSGVTPPGTFTVQNGGTHDVDTSYNTSTTAYRTNTVYGGRTYPRGTWRFNGWDRSGTLTITSNTVITGTWSFTPEWNITTSVENGTITPSQNNVPNGQSRTISYNYNPNYVLESVKVDGQNVDINTYKSSYTFSNITADHTIAVKYIPTYKVQYFTDAGGVSVSAHEDQDPNNPASTRPRVVVNKQPQGAELVTSPDWIFEKWTTRKAVRLTDGTTIPANGTITMDQIKKVVVTEDLVFDAHHIPRPQIEITKTADERYRQKGEDVVFTIKAFNKKPYVDALMLNENNEYVTTRVYTTEYDIDIADSLPKELKLINVKARNIGPSLVDGYELDVDTRTNSFSAHFAKLKQEEPEFIVRAEVDADVWYEEDYPNTATIEGRDSRYPHGQDTGDDTAVVTVVKPNLEVTKTADKQKYHLDETIAYTIKVENKQANSHADNVVITDSDLPAGVSIDGEVTASTGTVTQSGNTFTVTKDHLLGGEDMTITFNAKMNKTAVESKTLYNKATVDCNELDPRSADATSTIVCNVTYEWDGPHPDKPLPESTIDQEYGTDYTVDITYKTGDKVKGVVDGQKGSWRFNGWDRTGTFPLKDDIVIKGTWTFIPEYDIVTEVEHGTITPTEIDIPQGETRVVSYTPDDGYQLKTLTVDGDDKSITEYPASYTFEDIRSNHTIKAVFELIPTLKVDKSSDKKIYNAGDTVTYTIKVSQTTDGAEARGVVIKDTLPEGLTLNPDSFEGVDDVTVEGNTYTVRVSSLTDSVTYTYTAVTERDVDHEELENIADATGSNVPDPTNDNNKVKSLTPKPTIEKLVSNENPIYGETITYYIKVKEPQEGIELRNAVVTDALPKGLEFAGDITTAGNEATAEFKDGAFTANIPVLSTESVFSFKAKVTAVEGKHDNVATLNGDDIREIKDNAVITVKEPKPVINKTVSAKEVSIGDTVTYTVTVSPDIPLIDATITDSLPDGVELIKDSVTCSQKNAKIDIVDKKITVKAETISEALILTYQAKVTAKGTLKNTVSLSAFNFPKGPAEAEAVVTGFIPEPKITKEVSETSVTTDETVEYTIIAELEKGTVYNAVITDEVPKGLELKKNSVKASSGKVSVDGNKITVTMPTLKQEAVRVTYSAKVKKAGKQKNIAALSGDNINGTKDSAVIKAKAPEKVKTGDEAPVIYIAVFAVSVLLLLSMIIMRFRRKKA